MLSWFSAVIGRAQEQKTTASLNTPSKSDQPEITLQQKSIRRRVFEVIESGPTDRLLPRLLDGILIAVICINVVAVCIESVDEIRSEYSTLFFVIEAISVAIFTVEYGVRLWVAPEHLQYSGLSASAARRRYLVTPYAIIDLLSILPFYLGALIPWDWRLLRVFRLIRFFKLAHYSAGLRSLGRAVESEWRALMACLIIMAGMTLVAGSLMYAAERTAQPEQFGSIPQSLWWAVVTLTTVGYGDTVPQTASGQVLGGVVMLFGLAMFALPIGIVATAFAQEVHRREFVVNWSMVARVPLFASLDAAEIADIMGLLEAQTMPAGAVIVRRGDPAHAIYFIASGEIDLTLENTHQSLGAGDFFGEIAVLRSTRRVVTAVTTTRTNILILSADDLQMLMARRPDIARQIEAVAESRMNAERLERNGNVTSEDSHHPKDHRPAP